MKTHFHIWDGDDVDREPQRWLLVVSTDLFNVIDYFADYKMFDAVTEMVRQANDSNECFLMHVETIKFTPKQLKEFEECKELCGYLQRKRE